MPMPDGPQFGEFNKVNKSTEGSSGFMKWTGDRYPRIRTKPVCSNCGSPSHDIAPMDPERPEGLPYCAECRNDYQMDNWEYFI